MRFRAHIAGSVDQKSLKDAGEGGFYDNGGTRDGCPNIVHG